MNREVSALTLDEILAAMAQRLGGRQRLLDERAVATEHEGTIGDMKGRSQALYDPKTFQQVMHIDFGIFKMANGFDGNSVWGSDPNGKVRRSSDVDAINEHIVEMRFSDYHYLVHPEKYDIRIVEAGEPIVLEVVDREFQDKPYGRQLVMVDSRTMLPVRQECLRGGEKSVSIFEDYQEHEGLMLPMVTRSIDGSSNEIVTRITSIRFETDYDQSIFSPPEGEVRDYTFLHGGASARIPLRIPLDHLYTDVVINGTSYEFIVDTGAGSSVLGADLAEALGLQSLGTVQGQGISGSQEISFVQLPEMIIGDVALHDQQIISVDLAELNKKMPRMRGLLGMDFLNRFIVKLDYVKQEMEVFDPEGFEYAGSGVEFLLDGVNVKLTFEGHEEKFTIDTGAGGLSIHAPFAKKWDLLKNKENLPSSSSIAGVGTVELTSYRALAHEVRIGEFILNDIPVIFAEIDTGAFANEAIAGNAGSYIWERFVNWFDFTGGRMWLEPNTSYGDPFRVGRFGMGFNKVDGRIIVDSVVTYSPASELPYRRGDELLEIDGVAAGQYDPDDLALLFAAPASATRQLKFRTASGEESQVTVTLRDYLRHYDA